VILYLHRLASIFQWLSWPARFVAVIAFAAIGYLLVVLQDPQLQSIWLTPFFLVFLWALTLSVFLHIFQGDIAELPEKGWWKRLKYRVSYFFKTILSVTFVVLTLAVIYFTLRVLRT